MKKRIICAFTAFTILLSTIAGIELSVFAATKSVSVIKEQNLYEWDLTDHTTFWSVSGEATPLSKTSGNNSACNFNIDENGAYMSPKAEWVAFNTTGACNNVDLTDSANTDIVIEYNTPVSTTLIIKVDMTAGDGDNFQECFFSSRNGKGAIKLNIKDLKTNKFSNKPVDVKNGYISLQLMTTTGGSGAAVTWTSARVVKYGKENKEFNTDSRDVTLKNYALTTGSSKGSDVGEVHTLANPTFTADGIVMNASSEWAGVVTVDSVVDISDPTTKLVAEITNNQSCNVAYKLVGSAIAQRANSSLSKELSLNTENGTFEIYLNQIFSEREMKILSDGKIKLQILLGSTGKPVTLKSLKLVKELPAESQPDENFFSYRAVTIDSGAGVEPTLPETVRVTTVSGRTADIAVTWQKPDPYNCNVPGTYIFTAIPDENSLKDNAVIYNPQTNGDIIATVTIKEALNYFELPVNNPAGWTRNGTDEYGTYTYDQDGLSITPSALLGYTNSNYTLTNVNLDVIKGISYKVSVSGAKWAIKVSNLTTGEPEITSGEIATGGEGFYDFTDKGWSGIANLRISLFSVGTNKNAVFHKVALDKKPVPKDSFVIDTTNPKGWDASGLSASQSGENDSGAYSFSPNGLSITSKGAYYSMSYMVSFVDLDSVKGMLYYIDAPNARWEIKVANLKNGQETQVGASWNGTLGTALEYFDFSKMGWSGTADLKVSVFVVISGSDDTCVFKNLQLLKAKPDPMPQIPKETAKTELTPNLKDYKEWAIGGKKLNSPSGRTDNYEYSFSEDGLKFKSKIKEKDVFYSSMSASYTNIDLDVLNYFSYKVSTPSAERWDVKIFNLSLLDEKGNPSVVTISGTWEGLAGSDEGIFSLPDSWIGACDIKIELFVFTSEKYTGSVNFSYLNFIKDKPVSPDSVTIDFSNYKAFTLSGNEIATQAKYLNKFGFYNFTSSGLTMSSERIKGSDGSTQFWCDADYKVNNIDFSKTDTIEFDVGLTLGNWTIQVKNLDNGEIVNYAKVVRPADQAWAGVEVPKKSFFNFVKAAKEQLNSVWSGNANIVVKFQALNQSKGSEVTFRNAKIIKGPLSVPTIKEYNFDFSKFEGWVIENEGLVVKPKGTTSNKVTTYNFASSGLSVKTEKQKIGEDTIFYSKLSYSIDYVDFDALNAITIDVTADNTRWDIALFCSTAPKDKNTTTISGGMWNGTMGSISGTKNFKDMGWTGIGTLTVQVIGLDFDEGNEIFVKSLSLGTGETTIKAAEGKVTSAEELEYATIKCPSLQTIQDILGNKGRFDIKDVVKEEKNNINFVFIIVAVLVIVSGATVGTVLVIRKKNRISH